MAPAKILGIATFGVAANLSLTEIVEAKDFAPAKAARPALGNYGLWFTVALAIVATASAKQGGTSRLTNRIARQPHCFQSENDRISSVGRKIMQR